MLRKTWIACLAAVVLSVVAAAPASAMMKRGFYADCYTYTLEACSEGGGCTSATCDQCDYYVDGNYMGSDSGCY